MFKGILTQSYTYVYSIMQFGSGLANVLHKTEWLSFFYMNRDNLHRKTTAF